MNRLPVQYLFCFFLFFFSFSGFFFFIAEDIKWVLLYKCIFSALSFFAVVANADIFNTSTVDTLFDSLTLLAKSGDLVIAQEAVLTCADDQCVQPDGSNHVMFHVAAMGGVSLLLDEPNDGGYCNLSGNNTRTIMIVDGSADGGVESFDITQMAFVNTNDDSDAALAIINEATVSLTRCTFLSTNNSGGPGGGDFRPRAADVRGQHHPRH